MFEMQDDIANAVAQALQIKLEGGELSRQKGGTQNLEAYQLYLRAKLDVNVASRESLDRAQAHARARARARPELRARLWRWLAVSSRLKAEYRRRRATKTTRAHASSRNARCS